MEDGQLRRDVACKQVHINTTRHLLPLSCLSLHRMAPHLLGEAALARGEPENVAEVLSLPEGKKMKARTYKNWRYGPNMTFAVLLGPLLVPLVYKGFTTSSKLLVNPAAGRRWKRNHRNPYSATALGTARALSRVFQVHQLVSGRKPGDPSGSVWLSRITFDIFGKYSFGDAAHIWKEMRAENIKVSRNILSEVAMNALRSLS